MGKGLCGRCKKELAARLGLCKVCQKEESARVRKAYRKREYGDPWKDEESLKVVRMGEPMFKGELKFKRPGTKLFSMKDWAVLRKGGSVLDSLDKQFGKSPRWKMTGNYNNRGFGLK